jgi:two-component system response regulator ChvI
MHPAHKSILAVDDDAHILDVLEFALKAEGYQVRRASDGEAALKAFARHPADLVILDLMLPGMDGTEVLRALRGKSSVPILMLTCRDEEIDRVLNLELGADDFVTKPFSKRELLARVKVLLRRVDMDKGIGGPRSEPRAWGSLELDESACRATFKGKPLNLSVTEFMLLSALMRSPGAALSRAQLLDALDPDDLDVSDRAVDSHIKRIRAKLKMAEPKEDPIEAVYGLGYRLKIPG